MARHFLRSGAYPFVFVCCLWLVFWIEHASGTRFVEWGILPRRTEGLRGVVTSVFIHGDLDHIASNSLPLLVLGMMVFYFYRRIALPVVLWIWLVSGLWLWIGGRSGQTMPMYHIGASTLSSGVASFLFFSGILRRHRQLMVVSLLVVFLYGSITWGMFPLKADMSWEGHLFGAIAGLFVAVSYRREGPQRRRYAWEDEEEEEGKITFPEDDQNDDGAAH